MTKILIFSESITSSHLQRPFVLAKGLAAKGYDVSFATTSESFFKKKQLESSQINFIYLKNGITSEAFVSRIRTGEPTYRKEELIKYIEADIEIIQSIQPDIILDDFRISLSMSLKKMNFQGEHFALHNIIWSPYWIDKKMVPPDISLTKILGEKIMKIIFPMIYPIYVKNIVKPFNQIRKELGMPILHDLEEVYSSSKRLLYMDPIFLSEKLNLVNRPLQNFIGPVFISVDLEKPEWWNEAILQKKPIVYVCPGSSGACELINKVVSAIKDLNITIIVSTAGADYDGVNQNNIFDAKFIPDSEILDKVSLYIGNGGSSGIYQSLKFGVPVISIPENHDQFMNSELFKDKGDIDYFRSSNFKEKELKECVLKWLSLKTYPSKFQELMKSVQESDALESLVNIIESHSERDSKAS